MSCSKHSLNQTNGYGAIVGETYMMPISSASTESSWTSTSSLDCSEELSPLNSSYESWEHKRSRRKYFDDLIFKVLGFQQNPVRSRHDREYFRNNSASDVRLSMLSNLSTAYNVVSISIPLQIMGGLYPSNTGNDSMCSAALIFGMIMGQLAGGTLGDVLGRHRAMTLVMMLQVTASFASAFSCGGVWIPLLGGIELTIYHVLAIWRLILGFGCGGVYPLSAILAAESNHFCTKDKIKTVALTFSFQGVGYLIAPVFAWMIMTVLPGYPELHWRLILGLGCIPGLALTIGRLSKSRTSTYTFCQLHHVSNDAHHVPDNKMPVTTQGRAVPLNVLDAICQEPNLLRKIIGTGGCWFLFDVLFYGNTLFQPVVLKTAFGSSESFSGTTCARDIIFLALLALPGYFVSVYAAGGCQSPKYIQIQGFAAMSLLYLFIALGFDWSQEKQGQEQLQNGGGSVYLLLLTYGLSFFFSNYGPNTTTFMLPSMTFSQHCRSTLNGLSAACGKAGALVGTLIFVPAASAYGEGTVFLSCSVLACIGMLMSIYGISDTNEDGFSQAANDLQDLEQHKQESKVPMKLVFSEPSLLDYRCMQVV